jgi:hypothetical protein
MSVFVTKRHRYQGQILGFMLALWPACGLTEEGAIPFPLTKVAQGIYVHQGLHEDYSQNNHGDIANLGFIVGSRCVAVLDIARGGTLEEAMEAVGDSEKDRWILFAQYHKRNVSKAFPHAPSLWSAIRISPACRSTTSRAAISRNTM